MRPRFKPQIIYVPTKRNTRCNQKKKPYLLDYHNAITEFRPAAAYLSRRLCFSQAYASWRHQSMTGLTWFGPSNGYKVIFFADFCITRIKYPSHRGILLHTNDLVEPAQPLNINTLHNVYVVERHIQLTFESNAQLNATSHCNEDLMYEFSREYSQGCCISA